MSKVMFVTVGTSLFTSATWEPRKVEKPGIHGLPARIEGYEEWLEPDLQKSPEQRVLVDRNRRTREDLANALTEGNAASWAAFLPTRLAEATRVSIPMRFSAELATIVQLAMDEGEEAEEARSLRAFLRSYDRIHLVSDPETGGEEERRSRIAAAHLVAYLNALAGDSSPANTFPAPGIASRDAEAIRSGLSKLLERIDGYRRNSALAEIDFVVSGGYKLYGFFLAPLVLRYETARVRLIYVHETGNRVVVMTAKHLSVGGREAVNPHSEIGPGTEH